MKTSSLGIIGIVCVLLGWHSAAYAEDIQSSTMTQLKARKIDPSIMTGLDRELAIPQAWIDSAKKEPPVQILATWEPPEWKVMSESFRSRYPSVKLEYVRSSRDNRQVQALMAFKQGRYVADVITSFSSIYHDLREANGLVDLRVLPAFTSAIPGAVDLAGLWATERVTYWCMAYNTEMVKKLDLPKDWDDILTNPFWRNGNFALGNTPAGWLPVLHQAKGADWTRDFITRLFVDVKPQRRNEGRDASVQLTAAGEQAAVVPAGDYRVRGFASRGAPVSFHCPSIVPMEQVQIGILRGSPAPNGAKVFLNWFLSKEGQLGLYIGTGAESAHKDFQRTEFLSYPEEVVNPSKKVVIDGFDMTVLNELQKLWSQGWNNEFPGQQSR